MSPKQIDWGDEEVADDETTEEVLEQFREPVRSTEQATGNASRWTDARHMREVFGIPSWDASRFDYEDVIPNCWEHSWDAGGDRIAGGTDFLARGKPGKGKSTLANYVAIRQLEVNNETVVWRGSSSRSEWLPLAPWTVLCLPAGVPITVRLESKDPTDPAVELDVDDLEKIVRDVRRYRDPIDLNRNVLEEGTFHVVYPDPQLTGCQEIYERDPEKRYDTPPERETLFSEDDPANHWWFAWALARVNHGPHHWTTWICDEIGDIAPQSARKDSYGTYQKVELLKDMWVDARKFGLSIFLFGHSEVDIHRYIRHKIRWRIQMPGTANPTTASDVVGFETVPMNLELSDEYPIGKALMYNETHFEPFRWADVPAATSYKLKIEVGQR
ncbi:ATP-binding protein [Halomicrobium salinisoli]|uniref:ATP-binding protein n=1 Tax=Halomicrobium salinisoli TaxID=2878391 RepID=UPI001CF00C56|nr:ATP-binding protein [Halomicrobium salinisoli]